MMRFNLWQWIILGLPVVGIVSFLMFAAGIQIHAWGISWIWAVFGLVLLGWRWLLVRWTQPVLNQVEAVITEMTEDEVNPLEPIASPSSQTLQQAEAELQKVLEAARSDPPLWKDWGKFWQRCYDLINAIALVYYPTVKRPLLHIYVPQAYALVRGTVDDLDQWMQKLSPVLNQATIGQVYQAYDIYQKLEPSARRVWQVWNWAQWVLNPVAALARTATRQKSDQANQQLLANMSQLLREAALRNLGRQAIALYSGTTPPILEPSTPQPALPKAQTRTLREILTQAESPEVLEQKPVNLLLAGRTGAGKSSLINSLFVENRAEVDVLPSTDRIQDYQWQAVTGESLILWDTPGYEQANRPDLRQQVLDHAATADLLLLLTPALDPALQMDTDFLQAIRAAGNEVPTMIVVTQVDRLRPLREWNPPYDWKFGDRPKEIAIREATQYRAEPLAKFCNLALPVVTGDPNQGRTAWGMEDLSLAVLEAIDPAKQLRLARFLKNLEARTVAAARIIDHYTFQMTTTQGLATLLKSPVLQFITTLTTGSPGLAYLLAEQIPVEQLPVVIGKLQIAYELFSLLNPDRAFAHNFDLLSLWSLLLQNPNPPERNAWAFGHAMVEYWTQSLTIDQTQERFNYYFASK
jgi:predicted GTPase